MSDDVPRSLDFAAEDPREQDVRSFLRLIDEFGAATERFFERLYRGLYRKQVNAGVGGRDPDQLNALRAANRELTVRMREAQTVAARLQAVFSVISEGVVMQDTEGRI